MEDAPRFDLQSHSTYSDGALRPADVVARAAGEGVELLALTDHDTVGGVDEALLAGRREGVEVVPAVELSAIDAVHLDLHVLGYRIDHHDPVLIEALREWREDRAARIWRMAKRLRETGWSLDERPLRARAEAGGALGRPHLATAVWEDPANKVRLLEEGLLRPTDVLVAYLIPGRPAFTQRMVPSVADAIAVVHAAGGVAIWAHPFWDVEGAEAVIATIDRFRPIGLDGVEAFYASHSEQETRAVEAACRERGLLTTGSADFHGPDHPHFARFRAFSTYDLSPNLGPIAI